MNEDKLKPNTWREIEDKKIPFDGSRIARHRFETLSGHTCSDLVSNKVVIYDAPELYQSQFDRLSDDERRAFSQADGVLRGARY